MTGRLDVKGVIGFLTQDPLPRRVFRHIRPKETAPTTPTELAETHFGIKQHSMQGWFTSPKGIPQDRLDLLAQWYGFESTIWAAWESGDLNKFKSAYRDYWDGKLKVAEQEPPRIIDPPAAGPRLRRVATGKDDHPVESLGAIDVSAAGQLIEGENAQFSGILICRPATVGSVRLAVKFCKVRLTRKSDAAELYDGERLPLVKVNNDRGQEVEVRPVGSGRPPTFEVQALTGAIEMVSLPDDIWRIPGLKRGDRFVVEVIVLLRDCTRVDTSVPDDAEPDPESKELWGDGNSFYRPGFKSLGRALETIQQRYEQLRLSDGDEDWGVLHRTHFVIEVMM